MKTFRVGDRIWVTTPTIPSEHRVGTIMAIGRVGNCSKYTVEWELELPDRGEKSSKYLASQIQLAGN